MSEPSLAFFHPIVSEWFTNTFKAPTPPQADGWPEIAAGKNILLLAPTGSGKTLAAFLKCLDWLYQEYEAGNNIDDGVKVLYISPLKALNNDIHRNLELPLKGITDYASSKGSNLPLLRTAVRSGDTPANERQRMLRKPPHILITTPESLFLMLSSKGSTILKKIRFVIVDEIHALFPGKRGAHLSISLERLEQLQENVTTDTKIQRIGLSATIRPLSKAAAFLGGAEFNGTILQPRPVAIIDTGQRKKLDLQIQLPCDTLTDLPEKTIWPSIYRQLLSAVEKHRTTLIFVNNRRLAERITANLNELAKKTIAMTHHGSISKEVRLLVEDKLKKGEIPCIVATSSLELGIDIGYIDLVIQIESPKEVARGLQRVGRAGHVINLPSKGRLIPKTRADLLETAIILEEMKKGLVEESKAPLNCIDILAQQLVAMSVQADWDANDMYRLIKRAYNYQQLQYQDFENTLNMLAGRFSAEEFVELRPRLYWDRSTGKVSADAYGKQLVYSSGGTIPDRGYFGVYLSGQGIRLGELDEEFVYERRLNERFVLGTSTWRIEEIRRDRVIVTPSTTGGDAHIPFWKAEQNGRSYELGKRFGMYLAEIEAKLDQPDFSNWLQTKTGQEQAVVKNLRDFLHDQKKATGYLPTHQRLIMEEFPDEVGEWKVLLHSPFGLKTHTVLGLLIKKAWEKRYNINIQDIPTDDGVIFHCPGGEKPPAFPYSDLPLADLESRVAEIISDSALFGVTFRHAAQRSLVLPRGAYGRKRNPLWLSRLKAGNLLQTVSKYQDFPLIIETYREIMQNYFDLDGVRQLIQGIRERKIEIHHVSRKAPSPFGYPHLFSLLNNFMYDNDTPRGEHKLQLFGMAYETLRDIVGDDGYRQIFDQTVINHVILRIQGRDLVKKDPTLQRILFWLERIGDVYSSEITDYFADKSLSATVIKHLNGLCETGQTVRIQFGKQPELFVAARYLPEYLTALPDVESAFGTPENIRFKRNKGSMAEETAKKNIIRRYARLHGPFSVDSLHQRYGFSEETIQQELVQMVQEDILQPGRFLPDGFDNEWCDKSLFDEIHRRSLAAARKEVEPKESADFALFLAKRHNLTEPLTQIERFGEILEQLDYLWLPASLWEKSIFPVRFSRYNPHLLDQFIASGQYRWRIQGTDHDFKLRFEPVFSTGENLIPQSLCEEMIAIPVLESDPAPKKQKVSATAQIITDLLTTQGALSFPQILYYLSVNHQISASVTVWQSIEELMLAGLLTNDTFGPVRYLLTTDLKNRSGAKGVLRPSVIAQMGRWSLLPENSDLSLPNQAELLLKRYGVVCREVAQAEELSWSLLYPIYDLLENTGKIRRGYFMNGLSGVQYALSATLDELRSPVSSPTHWALAWDDPANILKLFPDNPIKGDYLAFQSGEPVLSATVSGKKIKLNSVLSGNVLSENFGMAGLRVLTHLLSDASEKVVIASIDGKVVIEANPEALQNLYKLGFEKGYKELTLWPSRKE